MRVGPFAQLCCAVRTDRVASGARRCRRRPRSGPGKDSDASSDVRWARAVVVAHAGGSAGCRAGCGKGPGARCEAALGGRSGGVAKRGWPRDRRSADRELEDVRPPERSAPGAGLVWAAALPQRARPVAGRRHAAAAGARPAAQPDDRVLHVAAARPRQGLGAGPSRPVVGRVRPARRGGGGRTARQPRRVSRRAAWRGRRVPAAQRLAEGDADAPLTRVDAAVRLRSGARQGAPPTSGEEQGSAADRPARHAAAGARGAVHGRRGGQAHEGRAAPGERVGPLAPDAHRALGLARAEGSRVARQGRPGRVPERRRRLLPGRR